MSKYHLRGTGQFGALLLLLTLPLAANSPLAAAQSPAKPAAAQGAGDPSSLPSEIMRRASKSLLLDVVKGSNAYFAVGERGHVLRSTDGSAWSQLASPTRSTLTTIGTMDGELWVGGYDGVILHSPDGGQSWQMQRRDPFRLQAGQSSGDHDPRQGAPILDIHFIDARNGIAIGAYSLMLVTHDGGGTWTQKQAISTPAAAASGRTPMQGDLFSEADLQLDEESDPHLNSVTSAGTGVLVVVGERGIVLRSNDGGETWQKLAFPYKGSMFGVLDLGNGHLLAYGLRGNVYESADTGSSWSKVETQGNTSLMGGAALAGGGVVLVGANGTILRRTSFGTPFTLSNYKNANGETPALAGVLSADGGNYVLVGDKGVDLAHLQ